MADKKKQNRAPTPVHTIKVGQVSADIYQRQSNTGFPYYDFQLTRTWKSISTNKEVSGSSFFNVHRDQLTDAVTQASSWIAHKMTNSNGNASCTPNQ